MTSRDKQYLEPTTFRLGIRTDAGFFFLCPCECCNSTRTCTLPGGRPAGGYKLARLGSILGSLSEGFFISWSFLVAWSPLHPLDAMYKLATLAALVALIPAINAQSQVWGQCKSMNLVQCRDDKQCLTLLFPRRRYRMEYVTGASVCSGE